MQRVDNPPDNLYVDGNPYTHTKGTIVPAAWLNALQEEVATVIEETGLTLDELNNAQLWESLLRRFDFWRLETATVTFVDASSFKVAGDVTAVYVQHRAVKLTQTSDGKGYVVSSVYSSGPDETTVTVTGITVDSGLTAVEYGQEFENMPYRIRVNHLVVSNWTTRTTPADLEWRSVCWSPGQSLFVAVAITGTGNRVMTSPDGITWTTRTSAADNNWQSVCWSPGQSLFVAVAASGTGNRVMTSPDGITWTTRTSAADNNWQSVCWSPGQSLFVAVAITGIGNRVMTSPDGITWTIRTSAADNNWTSVCWSPELGLFVAVAISGTSNRVMTSPDGITWTTRTPAVDAVFHSVCWSPENGVFVAISSSGTGNRAMTSLFFPVS
jgi:hypothetical protein